MNRKPTNNRMHRISKSIHSRISRWTFTLLKTRVGGQSTKWIYQFCIHIVDLKVFVIRKQMNLRMPKKYCGMIWIGRRTGMGKHRTSSGPRQSYVSSICRSRKSSLTTPRTWSDGCGLLKAMKRAMLDSIHSSPPNLPSWGHMGCVSHSHMNLLRGMKVSDRFFVLKQEYHGPTPWHETKCI